MGGIVGAVFSIFFETKNRRQVLDIYLVLTLKYSLIMKNKQKEKVQAPSEKPKLDQVSIESNSTKSNDGGYIWLVGA